jgi:lipoprotein
MLKRKNIVSLALSFMLILTSLLFVGCGKKPEEKPQPTPSEEKRICSFSILNLDSEFPINAVSITVPYGINSATVNLENYKAVFIISKNDGSRVVLQSIENLENDDYSFTVSDGNYSYKKETVLSLENSFFDKTDGEFAIGLCLFEKANKYLEVPVTGYQYNVAYKITDSKIAFEVKNGAVIRNH